MSLMTCSTFPSLTFAVVWPVDNQCNFVSWGVRGEPVQLLRISNEGAALTLFHFGGDNGKEGVISKSSCFIDDDNVNDVCNRTEAPSAAGIGHCCKYHNCVTKGSLEQFASLDSSSLLLLCVHVALGSLF